MSKTDNMVLNTGLEPDGETGISPDSDAKILENIKDSNPKTWLNEDMWRTFGLMIIFYLVSALFKAGSVDPNTGSWNWSMAILWVAIDTTMLPLFGAAIRNQVLQGANRKLEDQNRAFSQQKRELLKENKNLSQEVKTLNISIQTAKEELYKARADLNAKCETLEAIKEANGFAKHLIESKDKLK